jgi:CRP-like cAMP-binding protein
MSVQPSGAVRLLDVEPELGRFLLGEEREQARHLVTPVLALDAGRLDMDDVLGEANAFGALILDGLCVQRLQIAQHQAMRLLGPGDVLSLSSEGGTSVLAESSCTAMSAVRVALLGKELLLAARRWPRLLAGIHIRLAHQADRVAAQLAICQLPRVADRLLAIMWLLAETWGRVTGAGLVLPLALTHDALGSLIGARRPTVTLAIGELTARGAVVRQPTGWLLLEPVAVGPREAEPARAPELLDQPVGLWAGAPLDASPSPGAGFDHEEMIATVARLRAEHERRRQEVMAHLAEIRKSREEISDRRRLRQRRPPAPSS